VAAPNAEVARLWWTGLNEEGMPPLELCHPSISIEMFDEFPIQGPYLGHDGVRAYVSDIFETVDEARIELDEAIEADDGETLVTVQRAIGRARHTRIEIDFEFAAVWRIVGGLVVSGRGYATRAEALEAAGLQP
jgi:ketosteroid isomerase-like protein